MFHRPGLFTFFTTAVLALASLISLSARGATFCVNSSPGTAGATLCDSAPVSASGHLGAPPGTFSLYGGGSNYWSIDAFGRADRGSLGASTHSIVYFPQPMTIPGLWGGDASVTAYLTIDDLVISGPGGSVSGSMRLQLDGGLGANAGIFGSPHSIASSTAAVQIGVEMRAPSFLATGVGYSQTSANQDGILPGTTRGLLADYHGGPMGIEIPFTDAPVGTPITLYLSLYSFSAASLQADGAYFELYRAWAEGISSYTNSLSFATSGNVFVLPEGYTANSLSAGIANNAYVVPLPAAAWLLGSGLLGLIGLARRCK